MAQSDNLKQRVEERVDEHGERLLQIINDIDEYFDELEQVRHGEWKVSAEGNRSRIQLLADYESVYSATKPLIKDYLADRLEEYEGHHQAVVSRIRVDEKYLASEPEYVLGDVVKSIQSQFAILQAVPSRVEAEELSARKAVSRSITTNEIEKATTLFEDGDIRPAGVVAGVSLERHLQSLCEVEGLDYDPMDGISSLATTLNTENRISDDEFRLLEHLGGLRNKCSHASEEEPTSGEVDRLINETRDFVSESDIR